MQKSILALALLSGAATTPALADCDHSRDLSLDLDARGAEMLALTTGAGSLEVEGRPGLDTIRITGRACASNMRLLEAMALRDVSRGERLGVRTEIPDAGGGWFGNRHAYIDVRVEVPETLALDVRDGSGEMELRGIGDLTVEDGSGEMRIRDARANVRINDGSGEIEIEGVTGDVEINDGSGEIGIDTVSGSVFIVDDGSGEIDIRNVGRDVRIGDDGSGSIGIRDVVGNVTIEEDGSGGITVRDVGGDLEVGSNGSGGVRYSGIQGRVAVEGEDRLK